MLMQGEAARCAELHRDRSRCQQCRGSSPPPHLGLAELLHIAWKVAAAAIFT